MEMKRRKYPEEYLYSHNCAVGKCRGEWKMAEMRTGWLWSEREGGGGKKWGEGTEGRGGEEWGGVREKTRVTARDHAATTYHHKHVAAEMSCGRHGEAAEAAAAMGAGICRNQSPNTTATAASG